MDKELKGLVGEIVIIIILIVIVIPVCVSASNDYQAKKGTILEARNATVDISNTGKIKDVTVYSNSDKPIKVNLYLKINKFDDDYIIGLDGKDYNLRDFDVREDDNNRYYNLGFYDIDKLRTFKFKIEPKGKSYYDETITYSFITEGMV